MFRLALSLGTTLRELEAKMDSRELSEWMAYYSLEPWGSPTDDYQNSLLCATVANAGLLVSSPKALRQNPFHPKDFMIRSTQKSKSSSWQESKAIMESNMIRHNSLLDRKKK